MFSTKNGSILWVMGLLVTAVFLILAASATATPSQRNGDEPDPTVVSYLPVIQKLDGTPTVTPTATPTATITPTGNIKIIFIEYNPDGDDLAGEFVLLQNQGSAAQDMTGWLLEDANGRQYTFPAFVLAAGDTVTIWSKSGTDSATDLYWGSGIAIWTNTGDTATLRDSSGVEVDSCSYAGGGISTSCS